MGPAGFGNKGQGLEIRSNVFKNVGFLNGPQHDGLGDIVLPEIFDQF